MTRIKCDFFITQLLLYSYSTEVTKIQNELGLICISSESFTPSTDVTFKFSDGRSIKAHGMILAAVSPVFDRMFYGDFKEGKSKEVDLPAESYNSTKLLIDFIHTRTCEIESLDDIVPLMELFDRYQINKAPIQHKLFSTDNIKW